MTDQPVVLTDEHRRLNADLLEHYERQVAGARSYSTLITGIGYAGLLTLWSGSKQYLGPTTVLATGALIGMSLFVFALFEIAKINVTQAAEIEFFNGVEQWYGTSDFSVRMQEKHAGIIARTAKVNRLQPYVFWLSSVSGFGAAIWTFGAMAASALRLWGSC